MSNKKKYLYGRHGYIDLSEQSYNLHLVLCNLQQTSTVAKKKHGLFKQCQINLKASVAHVTGPH